MNTTHTTTTKLGPIDTTTATAARIKGAGLATVLTVAMLLGINTLSYVAPTDALLAAAATHSVSASAAHS